MTEARNGAWDSHVHVFDAAAPTRPGHYLPAHRPLAQIEATAAEAGVHHLVLVQPSVYGSDNRLLLQALACEPGRHRGVVVLAGDEDDAALDALHAAGVRGARFNLVSPVGEAAAPLQARFDVLAPRLRRRGWHLQWYASAQQLPVLAALHAGSDLPCVLDHLAGVHAELSVQDPAWSALRALAEAGAWVKLSGWYRLGDSAPYARLRPQIQRVAALFGAHLVWGSDWPHTAFASDTMPAYASLWQPVVDALGLTPATRLRQALPAIYA